MQDWVVEVVSRLGVWGIALLMFLENVFPPLPSEVIMPLAGYLSTRGDLAFWPAVMAGTGGSLAGAMFWYWVGLRVSRKQLCDWVDAHGIWIAMTPEDVDRAVVWFQGHGRYSVLLGRLMPLIRTLISVPAGFSRMLFLRFLVLSAVGTVMWTTALAYAGRVLGQQFHGVDRYIGLVSWVVVVAAFFVYIRRVFHIRRARSAG